MNNDARSFVRELLDRGNGCVSIGRNDLQKIADWMDRASAELSYKSAVLVEMRMVLRNSRIDTVVCTDRRRKESRDEAE